MSTTDRHALTEIIETFAIEPVKLNLTEFEKKHKKSILKRHVSVEPCRLKIEKS